MRIRLLLRTATNMVPFDGWRDRRIDHHLDELGTGIDSTELTTAALLVMGSTIALTPAVGFIDTDLRLIGLTGLWLGALLAVIGLLLGPRLAVQMRRARALGDAPHLVGLAVLRLRVTPTPETAAVFAAEHAEGPLARTLEKTVRSASGSASAGWNGLAERWGGQLPELRRGISLLTAASVADPADRDRLLDRSLDAVLAGTRQRMTRFASDLQGPATAVYAFGVVLPLAFVGALPTLRAAGIAVGLPILIVIYDLILPAGLVLASLWLLARRPAAFPSASVPSDHPDLPARRRRLALLIPLSALLGYTFGRLSVPTWGPTIAVPGMMLGTLLVTWYRPHVTLRNRTRAIEAGFPDALTIAAQAIRQRRAPEAAVGAAGSQLVGPAGTIFQDAARVQERLGVGIETAFLGRDGALRHLGSPRLRAGASLLALAAREGPRGGTVLVALANHLDELRAVEAEIQRELGTVVGTLRSTAWCFAPLIGGTTVALASRLDGASIGTAPPGLSSRALAIVIGVYVLLLAAVLSVLATGLSEGPDRAQLGYHVGLAVLSASVMYPLSVFAASLLV